MKPNDGTDFRDCGGKGPRGGMLNRSACHSSERCPCTFRLSLSCLLLPRPSSIPAFWNRVDVDSLSASSVDDPMSSADPFSMQSDRAQLFTTPCPCWAMCAMPGLDLGHLDGSGGGPEIGDRYSIYLPGFRFIPIILLRRLYELPQRQDEILVLVPSKPWHSAAARKNLTSR